MILDFDLRFLLLSLAEHFTNIATFEGYIIFFFSWEYVDSDDDIGSST